MRLPTSARRPARPATGANGSRSWRNSSATWRIATAPTRSAPTGTSRCGTSLRGCTPWATPAISSSIGTPSPGCSRATRVCAWAVRRPPGEVPGLFRSLIAGSINTGTKLDFLTYHRYADDPGGSIGDVTDAVAFHADVMNIVDTTVIKGTKF